MSVAALLDALGPEGEEARRGRFAAVLDDGLCVTTDGLGTKAWLYAAAGRYETAGWDVVAVNANDLAAVGARPDWLTDHVAFNREDPPDLTAFARGMSRAAHAAGVRVVGGEVEALPRRFSPTGFRVSGTMGGHLHAGRPMPPADGHRVEAGDALIALPASGPHCNGIGEILFLAVDRYAEATDDQNPPWLDDYEDRDWLLRPTPIYSMAVREMIAAGVDMRGGVHVSGGGWRNLDRLGWRFELDSSALFPFAVPEFARLMERADGMPWDVAIARWNMGVGFLVVVPPTQVDGALAALRRQHPGAALVGSATDHLP